MPLPPSSQQPWPPERWKPFQDDIERAADWYAGDPLQLDGREGELSTSRGRSARWGFWERDRRRSGQSRSPGNTAERRLHVPAAADIAATGADLLFGDTPTFTIPDAHGDHPSDDAKRTEARLHELIEADGWSSTLLEGAEIAGALGGVLLRPVVDPDIADHPILTVVHPDRVVLEFRHGKLWAATVWREFGGERGKVWRHLERHEPGRIEHGLYAGSADVLGERRHLSQHPQTEGFVTNDADPFGGGVIDLTQWGITTPLVRYVPNALPNRRHRTEPVGRPDTANCEALMQSLDETWTSWVRDIRLAKARLVVPDEFLDTGKRGQGAVFDQDREVFSPLQVDPAHHDKAGITMVQFAIRVQEHEETARALFEQIAQTAGYSAQSFGVIRERSARTATEVDADESLSLRTTRKKQGYWRRALTDVAEHMLLLDAGVFGRADVTPMRPTVEYPDAAEADMREVAATLNLINLARAASIETRVRMLNPRWTNTQVQAEVARIVEENSHRVEDPFGGQV